MSTTMAGPPAFHLLAKPTGPICNLDCEYCFFLSKEMLYPGDRFRMSSEMLETYIIQLLEAHRTPEVAIAWQGGEPTMMGLDFFKKSVELVEKHRKPWQKINYTIQTNGTLLHDRWAAFFKENGFPKMIDMPPSSGSTGLRSASSAPGARHASQVCRALAFARGDPPAAVRRSLAICLLSSAIGAAT